METEELIEQIRQIKVQYEVQVSGQHKQWPKAIKDRVIALSRSGLSIKAISASTEISQHTVASWTARVGRKKFQELAISKQVKALPVLQKQKNRNGSVTKRSVSAMDRNRTVTITTPSGYKIEELSLQDLMGLLRSFGGI
jgi:hypothetical protein